ncbi:MAG: DUF2341 domain-containing protein [archaeon]|nr:DUF2341 domain-containing protein [archaeon]
MRKWLSGWDKRVKITVDHNDVTNDLSNFPVLIYLSSSSGRNNDDVSFVFNELQSDANRKKIAVTTSDKTTQCYVEIEKWDTANGKAWLWVKVPSIISTTDTELYFYYDKDHADNTDYVGDIGDVPAQNVWADWKTVCHMAQSTDSGEIDSVTGSMGYAKTGTVTSVDGKIGKARRSTNGDSNYLVKSAAGFPDFRPITVMAWLKFGSWLTAYARPFSREPSGSSGLDWECGPSTNYRLRWWVGNSFDSQTALTLDTWYFVVTTYVNPTTTARIYINGAEDKTGTMPDSDCSNPLYLFRSGKGTSRGMDGYIDEFRMYNGELSAAWIKASFESERDHLVDFGSEETW